MRINNIAIAVMVVVASSGVFAVPVDLAATFVCPDVSPVGMRITEHGLVMGGITYPLVDANASSSPGMTNAIFGTTDRLSEIDIRQDDSGAVEVSYIKFRVNPYSEAVDPDAVKIFEKASFGIEDPPSYFHSKNKGCRN